MKVFCFFLFIYLLLGCKQNDGYYHRSIQIDINTRAEGRMSTDSTYDGVIKFYDVNTKKLIKQYTYKNGVLNGDGFQFFDNGRIAVKTSYENGKENGESIFYNEKGDLLKIESNYYGLRSGSVVAYKNNIPSEYWFLSLEGEPLMYLNYNSIKNKTITDEISEYFFWNIKDFSELAEDTNHIQKQLFLYTPSPPNYKFEYSIVLIDNTYQVQDEIKVFEKGKNWVQFVLPEEYNDNHKLALKLKMTDPYSGDIISFKKLFKN